MAYKGKTVSNDIGMTGPVKGSTRSGGGSKSSFLPDENYDTKDVGAANEGTINKNPKGHPGHDSKGPSYDHLPKTHESGW